METNRITKTDTSSDSVPAQAKIAFIPAAFDIDQMPITIFEDPNAQSNEPHKSDTDTKHQSFNTSGGTQLSRLQVKTMSFHITKYLLHPLTASVRFDQRRGILRRIVSDKEPEIFFTLAPVQDLPNATKGIRLGHLDPTDDKRFTRLNGPVAQEKPLAAWQTHFCIPGWRMTKCQ